VILIAHELFQVERRRVVKEGAALAQQERFGIHLGSSAFGQFRQHGGLGGFQHAIEPTQHGKRQDDLAMFRLLAIAAQQIGNRPDERGKIGVAHADWCSVNGREPVAGGVADRRAIILAKKKMRENERCGERKIQS
jgi:hypothetical protein